MLFFLSPLSSISSSLFPSLEFTYHFLINTYSPLIQPSFISLFHVTLSRHPYHLYLSLSLLSSILHYNHVPINSHRPPIPPSFISLFHVTPPLTTPIPSLLFFLSLLSSILSSLFPSLQSLPYHPPLTPFSFTSLPHLLLLTTSTHPSSTLHNTSLKPP